MRSGAALAGAAVLAAATVVWRTVGAAPQAAAPATVAVPTTTTPVVRGDVTQRVQVTGVLGYGAATEVVSHLPAGILTAAAPPGTVLRRGGRLFAVSGTAAVVLYGRTPAYRPFAAGMVDGPDVAQLERNLVALGVDPDRTVTVDDHFGPATAAAVRRWQAARGLPAAQRTGSVALGQVVFQPGPVRVDRLATAVGGSVAAGAPVLSVTGTAPVVTAQVSPEQRYLVRIGGRVQVTLPAGDQVAGTVARIDPLTTQEPAAGGAPGGQPAFPVTVAVRLVGRAEFDQAPVQVAIVAQQRRNVLLVPVTALLARPGGGYQVRVRPAGGSRLVDVEPGLADETAGTVEVTGRGLAAGLAVEVPAP